MQWYYQDEADGQTPFDESYIAALSSGGRIKPTTLVWNDTLSGWVPAAEAFPEAYPGVSLPPSGVLPVQSQAAAVRSEAVEPETRRTTLTHEPVKIINEDLRELVKDLASYISANRFWMKFLGVLMIISGVLQGLTIVGLLIAWLPVWSGVLLFKAADSSLMAESTGTVESIEDTLYRIGLFFKINGIFALAAIVLYSALTVGFLVMGGVGLLAGYLDASSVSPEMNPFGGDPSP